MCETDALSLHLDEMFGPAAPPLQWDRERAYTRDKVQLIAEARHWGGEERIQWAFSRPTLSFALSQWYMRVMCLARHAEVYWAGAEGSSVFLGTRRLILRLATPRGRKRG